MRVSPSDPTNRRLLVVDADFTRSMCTPASLPSYFQSSHVADHMNPDGTIGGIQCAVSEVGDINLYGPQLELLA